MPRLLVPLTLASSVFLSACTVVYVQPEARTPAPQDEVDQPEPEQQPPSEAAPPQPDDPARRQPIEPRRRPAPPEPVRPGLPPDRPEPQPPVEPSPEPDRPIVPQEPVEPGDPRTVWVCHGETDSRWLRVPDRAAEAHSRHGDPVSTEPQAAGAQCERPSAEPPERREAPEPRQPERPAEPQTAWVCHGAASARWMQVPAPAAEAHRQHGDPVSTEPQPVGSPCARGDRPNTQPAVQPERPPAPERPQRPQMQTPRQPGNPQQPEPPAEQPQPPAEQPEPPAEQPRQPQPSPFAWVCHGEQTSTWQRVAVAAADAHRGHGDTVSTEAQEVGAPCQRDEAPAPQEPTPPPQEPGPPPQEPRQQQRPGEPQPTREPRGAQFVWVCHGDENPTWLRVAASAADAHREHGDTVSADAQEAGTACERAQGEPPPQEPEQPPTPEPGQPQQPEPPPEQPQEPQYVWVCHGARNATWQRVTVAAADAHRRHGDPVSTESREVGAACERGP